MNVILEGNIGFLVDAQASVWFSKPGYAAYGGGSSSTSSAKSTAAIPQKIINNLNIAPWGEDNRFPQNVAAQLDYCGVAKSALDFKARALWGSGIVWGKVIDVKEDGTEVFKPAKPGEHKDIEKFMRDNDGLYRYCLESNVDWCYYANIFPELVTTKDKTKIAKLVHQESCDCRFEQMDENGAINSVFISKLWGATKDQFPKFDPKKLMSTTGSVNATPNFVDNKYLFKRYCIDQYNSLEDLKKGVAAGNTNLILPVNYHSPNKPYYQVAVWDGARLSGWIEISAKIPSIMKTLYEKAFNIKYHVEIPIKYFEDKYGVEAWTKMTTAEKDQKKTELLQDMNKYLSGADNAHKTFVTYYSINPHTGTESGHVKITPIENKSTIDKELLASAAANSEILFAMQINPDIVGAGAPGGAYSGRSGSGSNIREAFLVFGAGLQLERNILLEPLRLIQQFNEWDQEVVFRFRDVVLTTLDQGKGTEKKVS